MEENVMNTMAEANAGCFVPFAVYDGLRVEYEDRIIDLADRKDKENQRLHKIITRLWSAIIAIIFSICAIVVFILCTFDFEYYDMYQVSDGITNFNTGEQGDVLNEPAYPIP